MKRNILRNWDKFEVVNQNPEAGGRISEIRDRISEAVQNLIHSSDFRLQTSYLLLSHYKWIPVIMFQSNTRTTNHTFKRIIGHMHRQFNFLA
jgi:hypothetical protein